MYFQSREHVFSGQGMYFQSRGQGMYFQSRRHVFSFKMAGIQSHCVL